MKKRIIEEVKSLVCEKHEVYIKDVLSQSRKREFVAARQEIIYRLRSKTLKNHKPVFTFKEIAKIMGKSDHSTVIHSRMAFINDLETGAAKL